MRRVSYKVWLSCCAAAAVLVLPACGRDNTDLVNGKAQFVQKCGACHVLERAGTRGIQGPDLDAAFIASRRVGMNEETFEGVVKRQMAFPMRGSTMPADLVTGKDADDVAAYVAYAAGKEGEDQGTLAEAGRPKVSGKPLEPKDGVVALTAPGGLAFNAAAINAPAGRLTLEMENEDAIPHDVAVKGAGLDEKGETVNQGGTSTVTVTLKAGSYTFYCSVPGHEEGGMKGKLTVK